LHFCLYFSECSEEKVAEEMCLLASPCLSIHLWKHQEPYSGLSTNYILEISAEMFWSIRSLGRIGQLAQGVHEGLSISACSFLVLWTHSSLQLAKNLCSSSLQLTKYLCAHLHCSLLSSYVLIFTATY
jgi:hypothetical protein